MKIKGRRFCIICEKEIFRSNNPNSKKRRRGRQCLTCSHECSKGYIRIYKYFKDLQYKKDRKK